MTTDEKWIKRIQEMTADQRLKLLDAKVEALWQLGEPREKTKIPIRGDIPLITDIELETAESAVAAISEKYDIKKHDLHMFRRAQLMELYHALGAGCPLRVELGPDIDTNIKWH